MVELMNGSGDEGNGRCADMQAVVGWALLPGVHIVDQ